MRVVLTGTPGTGKTTASEQLPYEVVHLNEVIEREGLWTDRDADRESLVADVDALREWIAETVTAETVIIESHLAHLFDADRVVVLRCRPDILEKRLRERGERARKAHENADPSETSRVLARKARENAESEALDVILSEAVRDHGADRVYEIDTTDRAPEAVAADIESVIEGTRDPSAGEVDFTGYLHP